MTIQVSGIGCRVTARLVTIGLLLALAAGCTPTSGGGGAKSRSLGDCRLVLAGVVDEADALAWAGQVEGAALDFLLRTPILGNGGLKTPLPDYGSLNREPAAYRGRTVAFAGKLVDIKLYVPGGDCARLGRMVRGIILLEGGQLVAFRARAERPPTKEAVGADVMIPVAFPEKGKAVRVAGAFLKRWVALDAGGRDYMVMPLVAAHTVTEITGEEAAKLARTEMLPGKLPLKPIPSPEVWRRPVVELGARGELRLDGKPVTWQGLSDALYPLAARDRNPLGDSALAVVVVADRAAPKELIEKLRKFPREHMGAHCVFRYRGAKRP